MEYYRYHALSCGIIQIAGVHYGNRNQFLNTYMNACRDRAMHPGAGVLMFSIILFSDNEYGHGPRIATELSELGTITRSPFRMNPNSGNRIALWTWNPSVKTLNLLKKHITNGFRYQV